MTNKATKICAAILTILVLESTIFIPQKTQAMIPGVSAPTFETNPVVVGSVSSETSQTFFEWAQTFLRETLKKRILDVMVDQIIQWIQGGGKPKFVTDWGAFLEDAADQAVGDFVQEIGAGFLCQPFNSQIQIGLLPVKKFSRRATCTLTKIVSNIESFYGNFNNGSWIAYSSAWEPQNNYYGAYLMTSYELQQRVAKAQNSAQNEAQAGRGFLSTKQCQEINYGPNFIGPHTRDIDGDGKDGDIASTCKITTPGDTIGELTAKAVGVDFDFIVNAQQLSEYVAAISNAIINRLIVEGVNGLRGLTTTNAPPNGYFSGGQGNSCQGLRGSALTACQSYITSNIANATSTLISQINDSLAPRIEAQTRFDSLISSLGTYSQNLGSIKTQLTGLTCTNKAQYIQAIQAEETWASSTVQTLQTQKNTNGTTIAVLTAALTNIQNFSSNSIGQVATIQTQIQPYLNSGQAQNLLTNLQNQETEIATRISQNLQTFNQNVTNCQLNLP